jgi:predicted porin
VLFWDDGGMSDVYQVTQDATRTRWGFRGSAKIDSDWQAGFLIEFGIRTANAGAVSQFADVEGVLSGANSRGAGDDLGANNGDFRHASWYLDSKTFGRVTIGQTDTPSSSTYGLTLANTPHLDPGDPTNLGAGFRIRNAAGDVTDVFWSNLLHPTQGSLSRRNEVMYTSPEFAGFQFKAAWGEADFWAVSLQYAGEFSGFRLAAKVAYADVTDTGFALGTTPDTGSTTVGCTVGAQPAGSADHSEVDCNHWAVGASVMHVATGLFLSGGYLDFTDNNRPAFADDNDTAWYVQGGLEQKFFAIGKTTLYGEYGEQENGNVDIISPTLAGYGGKTMSYWGLGIVQTIDAAAMDLYLYYRNYTAEVDVPFSQGLAAISAGQDLQMIGFGAQIQF